MKDKCARLLGELTRKRLVLFTRRGNISLRVALKLVRSFGYSKVLLQDQGGWITYSQFCEKEKLKPVNVLTDYGIINPDALQNHHNCVLLINSMPGYVALQDMRTLEKICRANKILIINDVSGSIGTKEGNVGDIVLGSFAIDKPVNLENLEGHGGFLATDNENYYSFFEKNNPDFVIDFKSLAEKLQKLNKRLARLRKVKKHLLKLLKKEGLSDKIIHKDKEGINVVVKHDSDDEKEKLINLAGKESLEFTLCPREIRVNVNAVCYEIKRK